MTFLNDNEQTQVRERLGLLKGPVSLLVFTHQGECETCTEMLQLMEELSALSELLSMEAYDLDSDKAKELGIERAPALAIVGKRDYGVRFYGLPTGFEFSALLDDLIDIGKGEVKLGKKTLEMLATITQPVHIQVYTTPICPVCPSMVRIVHRLAIGSDQIRADEIDSVEFFDEAERHGIQVVPYTIINDSLHLEGMTPEGKLVQDIVESLK